MDSDVFMAEFKKLYPEVTQIMLDSFGKLPEKRALGIGNAVYLVGTHLYITEYLTKYLAKGAVGSYVEGIEAATFENTNDAVSIEHLSKRLLFDLKNRKLPVPKHFGSILMDLVAWAGTRQFDMFPDSQNQGAFADIATKGSNAFDLMVEALDIDWEAMSTQVQALSNNVSEKLGNRSNMTLDAYERTKNPDEVQAIVCELCVQASAVLEMADIYLPTFYEEDERLFAFTLLAGYQYYQAISKDHKD